MALTRLAHQLVKQHFKGRAKGLAVDATCGNGHDTEFLARQGFEPVLGFDIQATAIDNTRARLQTAGINHVRLYQQSHEFMQPLLDTTISCAMFNFGYLPHADKNITTHSNTSIKALSIALEHLHTDGLICFICYPGHPEGAIETQAIQDWLATIKAPWSFTEHLSSSPQPTAPILYTISEQC